MLWLGRRNRRSQPCVMCNTCRTCKATWSKAVDAGGLAGAWAPTWTARRLNSRCLRRLPNSHAGENYPRNHRQSKFARFSEGFAARICKPLEALRRANRLVIGNLQTALWPKRLQFFSSRPASNKYVVPTLAGFNRIKHPGPGREKNIRGPPDCPARPVSGHG